MKPLLAIALLLFCATASGQEARHPYCVWPAVGGALGGVAIGWYGFVGISYATGGNPFDLPETAPVIAGVVTLEAVSMLGGAMAACALWGDEGRWYPTADSVIAGGMLGAALAGGGAYQLLTALPFERGTDNPVGSVLILTGAVTIGAVAGGIAGFYVDDALRGPPPPLTVTPVVGPDTLGAAMTLRF